MAMDYRHHSQKNSRLEPEKSKGWGKLLLLVVAALIVAYGFKSGQIVDAKKSSIAADIKTVTKLQSPLIEGVDVENKQAVVEIVAPDLDDTLIPYTDSEEYKQYLATSPPVLDLATVKPVVTANAKIKLEDNAPKVVAIPKIIPKIVKPAKQDAIPVEPHFDFYTILPAVEVEVPEHEIKLRIREEKTAAKLPVPRLKLPRLNQNQYILQAGSFRNIADALGLQSRLNAMGVESRIERAQIGEVIWLRVKMGPYTNMTSIMALKTRLKNNSIDALILEYNG